MSKKLPRTLTTRQFNSQDQKLFARLSGDTNPLHMDAVEARRTIMGAPVVHGMHVVLRAIEALKPAFPKNPSLGSLRVRFPHPVLVGDVVEFRLAKFQNGSGRIEGYVQHDLVLDLAFEFGMHGGRDADLVPRLIRVRLHDLSFEEVGGQHGTLYVGLDAALARKSFPVFVKAFGTPKLAELLALTRLVGMRCPGRQSLFSQFDVTFAEQERPGRMKFRVERTDARFLRVDMAVDGARLVGKLRTFYRPAPHLQPSISEIAASVDPTEFHASVALIIGGSRGLGEITAKIIAAGGGQPIITYYRGKGDAAAVAADIRKSGKDCQSVPLDVLQPPDAITRIFKRVRPPRTIYYFATPQILAKRGEFVSRKLFESFIEYYVTAFTTLIEAVAVCSAGNLRIFYPSSVAVTEHLRELAEYAMAKRAAEDVCDFYNRYSQKIECIVERLPRMKTDQTLTLVKIPAEDSLSVMLPIVRRVESVSAPKTI